MPSVLLLLFCLLAFVRLVTTVCLQGGCRRTINVLYAADKATAIAEAKDADAVIVFISTTSSEGSDRKSLSYDEASVDLLTSVRCLSTCLFVVLHSALVCLACLPDCQPCCRLCLHVYLMFARQVASVNPSRTIVAAVSPGAILMPWKTDVASIILAFMPGQMCVYVCASGYACARLCVRFEVVCFWRPIINANSAVSV